MAQTVHHQSRTEERLILASISATYLLYLSGTLYVWGAVVGWVVVAIMLARWYLSGAPARLNLSPLVWLWVVAMVLMLVVLWVGHSNWSLGLSKTLKSSIGWAKGWALIALFILIGATTRLSPLLLAGAVNRVAQQSLWFAVITLMAYTIGLPGDLFTSPLSVVGGPGDSVFNVSLYGLNPETGAGRWQFYAPWAPAAGLVACVSLVICAQVADKRQQVMGLAGCVAMIVLCQSRAGWVLFAALIPFLLMYDKFMNPKVLLLAGVVIPALLLLGQPLFEAITEGYQQMKEARPASTRVRQTLESIALQRWWDEAPWFGHGIVEPGPKLVEGMPIGSHHSWLGLLFVKGFIGLVAFAVPMFATLLYLFFYSQHSVMARSAFALLVVMLCYSFFENLEMLAYLYWPALIWIGMAMNHRFIGGQDVKNL